MGHKAKWTDLNDRELCGEEGRGREVGESQHEVIMHYVYAKLCQSILN